MPTRAAHGRAGNEACAWPMSQPCFPKKTVAVISKKQYANKWKSVQTVYRSIYRSVISISITNRSLDKSQTIGKLERAQIKIRRWGHGPIRAGAVAVVPLVTGELVPSYRRLIEFVIKPAKAAA